MFKILPKIYIKICKKAKNSRNFLHLATLFLIGQLWKYISRVLTIIDSHLGSWIYLNLSEDDIRGWPWHSEYRSNLLGIV